MWSKVRSARPPRPRPCVRQFHNGSPIRATVNSVRSRRSPPTLQMALAIIWKRPTYYTTYPVRLLHFPNSFHDVTLAFGAKISSRQNWAGERSLPHVRLGPCGLVGRRGRGGRLLFCGQAYTTLPSSLPCFAPLASIPIRNIHFAKFIY